jgi:adenylate cyclase
MIVGNMGSRKLFDYTVMGDNVNIGARLETANKNFGTEIVIGENTFHLVKDVFETRRLGLVAVKGRTRPVGAYELISEKGQCPPVIAKLLPHYGEGLAAYAEQKWDEAQAAFTRCLEIHPNDGPSRAYLTRCIELSRAAQVEHWDGTFTLEK